MVVFDLMRPLPPQYGQACVSGRATRRRPAPAPRGAGGVRRAPPAAAAVRTGLRQRTLQALPHALARHLDQAELRDLQDLGLGTILLDLVLQRLEELLAVRRLFHVDEVEHDDAAEVAQPNLPHDLLGRLHVRAEDGLLEILLADVLA